MGVKVSFKGVVVYTCIPCNAVLEPPHPLELPVHLRGNPDSEAVYVCPICKRLYWIENGLVIELIR